MPLRPKPHSPFPPTLSQLTPGNQGPELDLYINRIQLHVFFYKFLFFSTTYLWNSLILMPCYLWFGWFHHWIAIHLGIYYNLSILLLRDHQGFQFYGYSEAHHYKLICVCFPGHTSKRFSEHGPRSSTIPGCWVCLCSALLGQVILFSKAAIPVYASHSRK